MAFPNELGVGRINQLLQRLLQIKGGAPAPVLVPELQSIMGLEVDRPEWLALGGTRLWIVDLFDAAVVGQFSHGGVRVLAESGLLSVVTGFAITNISTAALLYVIKFGPNPSFDVDQPALARDLRLIVNAATRGYVFTAAVAQLGGTYRTVMIPAATTLEFHGHWILMPTGFLTIITGNANAEIRVTFWGYERALEQSEVTGL